MRASTHAYLGIRPSVAPKRGLPRGSRDGRHADARPAPHTAATCTGRLAMPAGPRTTATGARSTGPGRAAACTGATTATRTDRSPVPREPTSYSAATGTTPSRAAGRRRHLGRLQALLPAGRAEGPAARRLGNDYIYASHGFNDIDSGPGNDVVHAHFGRGGSVDCGSGYDVLYVSHRSKPRYRERNCERTRF